MALATMRFFVNVDHAATVREARKTDDPDPVEVAQACERAGADGITIHLREDRRHIQDDDVRRLSEVVTTQLNLELATADDIVSLATELKPREATFVPERREEITTEGGLNLTSHQGRPDPRLRDAIERVHAAGIRVSLFIDPDDVSIERAVNLGADAVELHTGEYANAFPQGDQALERIVTAVETAKRAGLSVHAGHGLTYRNVAPVAAIADIEEVSIGHSIISRSIMVGIEAAVSEMVTLLTTARVD